jgi:hypothetical protein
VRRWQTRHGQKGSGYTHESAAAAAPVTAPGPPILSRRHRDPRLPSPG